MKALRAYALAYPAALLLAFLCTWLAARVTLGHWPRPSLDDPKSIGFLVGVSHTLTGVLLTFGLWMFALAVLVLVGRASREETIRRSLQSVPAVSTIAMFAVIALMWWDPWDIVAWYFD